VMRKKGADLAAAAADAANEAGSRPAYAAWAKPRTEIASIQTSRGVHPRGFFYAPISILLLTPSFTGSI